VWAARPAFRENGSTTNADHGSLQRGVGERAPPQKKRIMSRRHASLRGGD